VADLGNKGRKRGLDGTSRALDILKERYARGESIKRSSTKKRDT
jgi:uncharacterized membrane protein